MSHHIYRTNAIVLSTRAYKEADILATFLTEDMGVLRAVVISGRKESSRHRYGIQPLSQIGLSLVRGKALWRVTGVQIHEQWQTLLIRRADREKMRRIANLIETLVVEEDMNISLYALFIDGMYQIANESDEATRYAHELLMVRFILGELGYMEKDNHSRYLNGALFSRQILDEILKEKATLIGKINRAIGASQLYRSL